MALAATGAVLAGLWGPPAAASHATRAKASPAARAAAPDREKLAFLATAIAEIEAGRRTTPLVGPVDADGLATVTFLAKRGTGPIPRIVSDVTGWGERPDDTFDFKAGTMARVGTGDWYFLEAKVAPAARIEYLVARDRTTYRRDPFNPRQTRQRGNGTSSEFVMPGYVPPQEFLDPPVASAGQVTKGVIESRSFGESREVMVYTPPGYRDHSAYPVAVFHGMNVVTRGEGPRVIDWLIARRAIEPIIAVFVDSWPRDTEEEHLAQGRAFLTSELPAWIAARYGAAGAASDGGKGGRARAILGISFGARDVLDAATCADVYDRVGLLIPGRRLKPADIETFVDRCHHRLRVAVLAGRYDAANLPTGQRARQELSAAGHDVDYVEVAEGHNSTTWRNHLSRVLTSLFSSNLSPNSRPNPSSSRKSHAGFRLGPGPGLRLELGF